ncbi:uncharacterized protein LOC125427119 [Sphaerodactylus townsendi]|uniref:uncharacterized protein LOC125427119 n=1 Tax=Sphaerodactylus townsendi TaxID=933632 RepID=UPI00202675F8|nr:uncharacterized protein LOC125427119 [Sphaerodactylus townsendi]
MCPVLLRREVLRGSKTLGLAAGRLQHKCVRGFPTPSGRLNGQRASAAVWAASSWWPSLPLPLSCGLVLFKQGCWEQVVAAAAWMGLLPRAGMELSRWLEGPLFVLLCLLCFGALRDGHTCILCGSGALSLQAPSSALGPPDAATQYCVLGQRKRRNRPCPPTRSDSSPHCHPCEPTPLSRTAAPVKLRVLGFSYLLHQNSALLCPSSVPGGCRRWRVCVCHFQSMSGGCRFERPRPLGKNKTDCRVRERGCGPAHSWRFSLQTASPPRLQFDMVQSSLPHLDFLEGSCRQCPAQFLAAVSTRKGRERL